MERRLGLAWRIATLSVLSAIILFWRRPDQFLNPYPWIKEGVLILPAYAGRGLVSFVDPIGGYYVLTTKVIMFAGYLLRVRVGSDNLGGREYAVQLLGSDRSCHFTDLRWRFLCAIALLLVPCGPEVFALPICSFFWASVLLCLALLWDTEHGSPYVRALYIIIGGLSSPFIIPFTLLLAMRAVVERKRSGWLVTGLGGR